MSAFGHQKDITFSIEKSPARIRERTSDLAASENTRVNNEPRGKQTPKTEALAAKLEVQSTNKSISKPPEPPKQKISKIKAFIDGKIIWFSTPFSFDGFLKWSINGGRAL